MDVCESEMKNVVSSVIKVNSTSRTRFSLRRRCPPNIIDWRMQGENGKKKDQLGPLSITLPDCFSESSLLSRNTPSTVTEEKSRLSITLPSWSSSESLPSLDNTHTIDEDNNILKDMRPTASSTPRNMSKKICAELVGKSVSKKRRCSSDNKTDRVKRLCSENNPVINNKKHLRNGKFASDMENRHTIINVLDTETSPHKYSPHNNKRHSSRLDSNNTSCGDQICGTSSRRGSCITPPLTPNTDCKGNTICSFL